MLQMSSGSVLGTKLLSISLNRSFITTGKKKGLVFDYLGFRKGRRHVIKASSDVASPSIWENWKPPKASSTHSFSDILWPSAGQLPFLFIIILFFNHAIFSNYFPNYTIHFFTQAISLQTTINIV